ncbi:MAG TPA: radical SAM protein [Clostridiales bacterium]|nr:radical SAM protein [Clostridiales bacterium]
MNNYVYTINNKLYINLTNRCSNNCDFCIRDGRDGMNGTTLWIDKEPTAEEVISALPQNLTDYEEVVFCGFGEPTYNLEALVKVGEYLHSKGMTTRINTNGQANLIHGRDVSAEVSKACDYINVSLNESNSEKYQAHCNSVFGEEAYSALLEFAALCASHGAKVNFSIVDSIGKDDIEECKKKAETLGVPLRIREKE